MNVNVDLDPRRAVVVFFLIILLIALIAFLIGWQSGQAHLHNFYLNYVDNFSKSCIPLEIRSGMI